MLGTPGSYKFDDSGMVPSHVQQPQTLGALTGDIGTRAPFSNARYPRLAAFWQRRLAGLNPVQGTEPPSAAPVMPPQANAAPPAAPYSHPSPSGARLGQLFSGYGY
jgi:hypothetical protein